MLQRKFIFLVLFGLFATQASGQVTLGLKFSPNISTNRVEASSDTASISTNGTGLRMAIGPIADIEIRDNYFFSTGLLFISKRAGIEASTDNDNFEEEYGLQYLQVPITLKLFTNEVALDKKIYFQVGGTFDFKVNDDPKDDANFLVDKFLFFDSSLLIGVGMEYRVGLNTIVFGGFTYQRGLINSIREHAELANDISLKNDLISLDLGVKF